MPYGTNRDREVGWAEIDQSPYPAPPRNLFVVGSEPGVFDLSWDSPASLSHNAHFNMCGVNVYRSFDSEFGPYHLLTDVPVGSTFWRDRTDIVVEEEVVTSDHWVVRGPQLDGSTQSRYILATQRRPIVRAGSQGVYATSPIDVQVWVDDREARVLRVDGFAGQIELDVRPTPNVAIQKYDEAVIPTESSHVVIVYRWVRSMLRTDLARRVFYRVTSVGVPVSKPLCQAQPWDFAETELERSAFTSNAEIEKLDYIWREAVRRNLWILSQGGERVLVFIKKQAGTPCDCTNRGTSFQPQSDCPACYGTGFLGGYEGPYSMILAPDDAERKIAQSAYGRTVEHTYEVWTGPSPLLSQRDFLVKLNGDRYSIGPVRMPTNRGMVLQQHFNIGHLDEADIRYRVPLDGTRTDGRPKETTLTGYTPAGITVHAGIPGERIERGHTLTWDNTEY